jgi:UDP-N-acetylglucosamine 4,6-dehydratase
LRLVITGVTGSLGSALIRQQDVLKKNGIEKIIGISRSEKAQVELARSYSGDIPLDCYLGDVTDKDRIAFALREAHYVIHAAAAKHIDKFELDVKTGHKTNILGTQNVADAFLESRNAVSGVLVSTDKAADPITAYGVSKLAAENLWAWYNTFQKRIKFGITRYGNVFGSNGSVIETWSRMSRKKIPLKITDPECTRFFMLVEDGARFVLNSLFHGLDGLSIPRMRAAKMVDVARVIWQYHGNQPMEFEQVGMRSVEKVHEILESGGLSSEKAARLYDDEIREMYEKWLASQL